MRRLILNILIVIIYAWFALVDRCLITSSGIPVSGEILTLLLLQVGVAALALLLVSGAFPTVSEALGDMRKFRLNLIIFGVPIFFFLASPALLSESMYEAHNGVVYRISADSPVGHALSCCWNPFYRAHR